MEDTSLLGVEELVVQDRQMWKAVIPCPTPSQIENYRPALNKNDDDDDDVNSSEQTI